MVMKLLCCLSFTLTAEEEEEDLGWIIQPLSIKEKTEKSCCGVWNLWKDHAAMEVRSLHQGDRLDCLKYFGSKINLKVLLDCLKCLKQGLKSLRVFVRRSNNPIPRQPAT